MTTTGMEEAEVAARRYLNQVLPEGTPRVHMRPFCYARLHWILFGGTRPPGRSGTPLTRQIVTNAVDQGLEDAFGTEHKGRVPEVVYARRDSD